MLVRLESDAPLHLQIYRAFRDAILSGRLPSGSRLPSSRREARTLGVSRNVVLQAYGQLAAEGYLNGSVGSGTYVADELPEAMLRAPAAAESGGRPAEVAALPMSSYARRARTTSLGRRPALPYDFAYGLSRPDDTTLRQWQRALRRASERVRIDYAPPEGEARLQKAIARHLFQNRGIECTADDVVITSGSQQALNLLSRLLFEPGDAVVLEEPSYQGARHIFQADGLCTVPVPVDEEGLDVAAAPAEARGFYVTPSHQFPTGVTMPLARRLKLLEWAERRNAVVIEDDYDSEYRYEGRPLEAIHRLDRSGRVIYVGTFSKVLFPAVRLGFVVLPRSVVEPFVQCKWLADRHSPRLEQHALADLIDSGDFEQHLRRTRQANASRRAALLEALRENAAEAIEISGANAGIHLLVWLRERDPAEVDALVERARGEGVGLYSIAPYYTTPPARAGLLMGYGNLDEKAIQEGVRRFARLLAN